MADGASYNDSGAFPLAPQSGSGAMLLNGTHLESAIQRCRLAILSACSTAAGERLGPFNPASLIQALWRAGVPTVIATRWEVEERATAVLVASLLQGLAAGVPAPFALRNAIRDVRRMPGLEHPAHWAAFHVFGASLEGKSEGL